MQRYLAEFPTLEPGGIRSFSGLTFGSVVNSVQAELPIIPVFRVRHFCSPTPVGPNRHVDVHEVFKSAEWSGPRTPIVVVVIEFLKDEGHYASIELSFVRQR